MIKTVLVQDARRGVCADADPAEYDDALFGIEFRKSLAKLAERDIHCVRHGIRHDLGFLAHIEQNRVRIGRRRVIGRDLHQPGADVFSDVARHIDRILRGRVRRRIRKLEVLEIGDRTV